MSSAKTREQLFRISAKSSSVGRGGVCECECAASALRLRWRQGMMDRMLSHSTMLRLLTAFIARRLVLGDVERRGPLVELGLGLGDQDRDGCHRVAARRGAASNVKASALVVCVGRSLEIQRLARAVSVKALFHNSSLEIVSRVSETLGKRGTDTRE